MREVLPRKQAGDTLSARHVNMLSDSVVGRGLDGSTGVGAPSFHSGNSVHTAPQSKGSLFRLVVSNSKINDDDADDSGLYLGQLRWYSHDGEEWKTDDEDQGQTWEIDARDVCPLLAVGEIICCYWDAQRGMFVPIESPLRRFELKTALEPGGSATAYLLYLDGSDYNITSSDPKNNEVEFEVVDSQGDLNGKARTEKGHGSRGFTKWMPDSKRWEIVRIQMYNKIIATTKGAVLSTAGSYTVDNVTPMKGISPLDDPTDMAEELTIRNTFSDKIDNNGIITASWNQVAKRWETDDVTCSTA
jgi:hypothetical protein